MNKYFYKIENIFLYFMLLKMVKDGIQETIYVNKKEPNYPKVWKWNMLGRPDIYSWNYKGKKVYLTKRWSQEDSDYWGFLDDDTGYDIEIRLDNGCAYACVGCDDCGYE